MRQAITSDSAATVGPYSHAVESGGAVYCSGQTPVDPATGRLVVGGIGEQTRQCFANLFGVLDAAGLGPDDVVKVNVYLTHMHDFEAMNAAYAEVFADPLPARTTVGVSELPLGAKVEIELIASRTGA
ncbi:MAG: RidA family protein [Acidimicrobiales bacterium]